MFIIRDGWSKLTSLMELNSKGIMSCFMYSHSQILSEIMNDTE